MVNDLLDTYFFRLAVLFSSIYLLSLSLVVHYVDWRWANDESFSFFTAFICSANYLLGNPSSRSEL